MLGSLHVLHAYYILAICSSFDAVLFLLTCTILHLHLCFTMYRQTTIAPLTQGVAPALLQGPLSRFGDTAANTGMLTALNASSTTRDLPIGVKTMAASFSAGLFRIVIMPIDTVKTTMQVTGHFSAVVDKVKIAGPMALYNGSIAAATATFVGHYP
jgi:hypothetical protein